MLADEQQDLVSVIIPAHNAEDTLGATLHSVCSQSYRALEIIVVDDGSSDRTAKLVEEARSVDARIRLLRQENRGVAAARNAAIAIARGGFVAPVDADDLWHPRKIERQMQVFRKSRAPLGFVYSWSRRIDQHGCATADQGEPLFEGNVFAQLLAYNFLMNASNAVFRTGSVRANGGYDTTLRHNGAQGAEDLRLALAIAESEPVGLAPSYLVGYRQLPGTMSADGPRMRRSMEMVLGAIEARRPDLPARLFELGRMHADLYTAGLALNRRDWPTFARLLARGVGRVPGSAARLLGCALFWRLREAIPTTGTEVGFFALDPHERLPALPLQGWLDAERARTVHSIVAPHGEQLDFLEPVRVR